ncbi:cell surface hyaluronidase-like [Mya arenaria]|uniref:cell surface hyaluronidase-like n=1 Tax=Mya arenaria TaxID=6604 RepID=UPI0022E32CA0|nr:cell surface hyaluronidase-like [Mya arenaria]
MVDEATPDFYNVTIAASGALTFDPEVAIEFRAANILVFGRLEIGSKNCPYPGDLTITLTGTREIHTGETNPKAILVHAGGTLDIHGMPKRAWTKLDGSALPDSQNPNIIYDHEVRNLKNTTSEGIGAYTMSADGTVKRWGLYHLKRDGQELADHMNSVHSGEILMMASQKQISKEVDHLEQFLVYDALETFTSGEPTGKSLLRAVAPSDGSTWAFIGQKGSPQSHVEVHNPVGVTSQALFTAPNGFVFMAEATGNEIINRQVDNFRVASDLDGIHPRVSVIDDVTTWQPGDRVVLASTDYGPEQAEEAEVVFCDNCSPRQFRINKRLEYTHFGELLAGGRMDMRGEVAVLTRRVVVQGEMEPECPAFNGNCDNFIVDGRDTFGAHIKILKDYANARMSNFELRNAGQQTDEGRYPIHFHMTWNKTAAADTPYIRSVSIHDTFARCITIHGTNGVEISDNACVRHMGHGYFLEDGGEENNVFDGNLAVNTMKGTGNIEPVDLTRPAAFWMTNPKNYFRNNVAAGGQGNGIWFLFPDAPLYPSSEVEGVMGFREAQRTMISEFTNNVAHSQNFMGVMIGNILNDDRTTSCCNKWQPLVDPKDPTSEELNIPLSGVTGYKNRVFNVWIEGGRLDVTQISSADSMNGVLVTNEGQQNARGGKFSYGVIIGESENRGVPSVDGVTRSLDGTYLYYSDAVQSGLTMWKGPTKFSNLWFDSFQDNDLYDLAAIAKKRNSPYFFSVVNEFTNISFTFDDGVGQGTYAISGDKTDPGWEKSIDGELISGFTFNRDENGLDVKYYVVKPDPLSAAAADCRVRPNWRLALCSTKYGNLRTSGVTDATEDVIFVRDQVPGSPLHFDMKTTTGPQVVMDGSSTYTVHFRPQMPSFVRFEAPGLDRGDKLRIGVCTPLGAELEVQTFHPYRLNVRSRFTQVDSLAELDKEDPELDGKKYYYDSTTGMMYYKFVNTETRTEDEDQVCNNGKCSEFRIKILSGDLTDADCRHRIYTSAQLAETAAAIPTLETTIEAKVGLPPAEYGAGPTAPFREAVDGGWGLWGGWSECSRSCGEGTQYRLRQCNNPLPQGAGASCEGDAAQPRTCQTIFCPINGELSEWSNWSACTSLPSNDATYKCSGYQERTRDCNNPPTQYDGEMCEGSTREIESCSLC